MNKRFSFLLLLVFPAFGCDHGHDHPHGEEAHDGHDDDDHEDHGEEGHEGHGHGEGAIGITRYTDTLELFAEHPPAVTGHELTFLAHLTILDGFQALQEATVTLVMDGPTHVEARVTEMLRPGIFQPTLTAPAPGTYRCSLVVTGPQAEDTIDDFEIVVHAASADVAAGEEEEGESISFLKEQQWQVPFGTSFATEGSVVPTIEVAGEVTTPPSGQADIGSAITGRIVSTSTGLPRTGQEVHRGELLATIAAAPAAPEDAARAGLAVVEADARVQAAQASVDRAERLLAERAISQRSLDEARRELGVAEASGQAARRARSVFSGATSGRGRGTYRITSPIDGILVEVRATEGRSVQSGEVLFRVVNLDELWVRAAVPEQQAATIRADESAAFKLAGLSTWMPLDVRGEDPAASVVSVGRVVHERSRTVDVIYSLSAPDERLRVGAMLRVAVPVGEAWQGVVVPREAVLDDDGRAVVYVQVEGESFDERAVRLGPRSGAFVGIESGITAGERVVSLGANVIRLSSRSSSTPAHGHVH